MANKIKIINKNLNEMEESEPQSIQFILRTACTQGLGVGPNALVQASDWPKAHVEI